MRALMLAAILSAASAGAAFAGTIENSFGNTIVVRGASGAESRWHYNADGTYVMNAGPTTLNGTWTQAGAEVCVTPEGGARECFQLPPEEKRVGDAWSTPDGAVSIQIIAGR